MDEVRTVVDVETGEVITIPVPKKKKLGGWCRMFQIKLEELSKDEDLRGMPMGVLLYMISKMDYENSCKVPQVVLAREFNTRPQYMSKIIKTLKDKKIIEEVNEIGEMKYYRLSSQYVIKGKQKQAEEPKVKVKKLKVIETKPQVDTVPFEDFWMHWPKKVGKEPAKKLWAKMKVDEELFFSIKAHLMTAYNTTDKKYIPNPSTYLNQKRWNDEVIEQSSGGLKSENSKPSLRDRIERGMQFQG